MSNDTIPDAAEAEKVTSIAIMAAGVVLASTDAAPVAAPDATRASMHTIPDEEPCISLSAIEAAPAVAPPLPVSAKVNAPVLPPRPTVAVAPVTPVTPSPVVVDRSFIPPPPAFMTDGLVKEGAAQAEVKKDSAPMPTLHLANGDEFTGTIGKFSSEEVAVNSDAGPLELPTARVAWMSFPGSPSGETRHFPHLRFHDSGLLSVKDLRIENDRVKCSTVQGQAIEFPLALVKEVVWRPLEGAPAATPAAPNAPVPLLRKF